MLRSMIRFFLLLWITGCFAAQSSFQNGIHYVTFNLPAYNNSSNGVEVLEFFWYGCPHCYELEKNPVFVNWLKEKSKQVHFQRVPVSLGRKEGEVHAKLYYVTEFLFPTASESIHQNIFDAFNRDRRLLVEDHDLISFFQEKKISPKEFKEMWDSYGVVANVSKASALARHYRITGVPTFVVGGRYLTELSKTSGVQTLVELLDFLVAKSKSEKNNLL